jgi:peptidoglycan LD-endopeptidase LytH
MKQKLILWVAIIAVLFAAALFYIYQEYFTPNDRSRKVFEFLRDPDIYQGDRVEALSHCGNAPFLMPTDGLIGFLWGDSFRIGHRHQGIDIFAGKGVNVTPVYSVYDGYLTRLPDWKATVIIRIPQDPLQPDHQIWTYYTHMADEAGNSFVDEAFPPGTEELWIPAGTLLGYQGNYSGTPGNPTGVHLHFSIVKDDGEGMFLNELDIHNTLDPSPYFGLDLNGKENLDRVPICNTP